MLILTRRKKEKIMINDDIVVHVLKWDQYQVRIGIEAPDSVRIMREEIIDKEPAVLDKPVISYKKKKIQTT